MDDRQQHIEAIEHCRHNKVFDHLNDYQNYVIDCQD
jgi:hypothetical protein